MSGASVTDVAPFIAAATVVLVSPIPASVLTGAVVARFKAATEQIQVEPEGGETRIPMALHEKRVEDAITYLLDAYQTFTVILIPVVSVFIGLHSARFTWIQVVLGIGAVLFGFLAFVWMQYRLSSSNFALSRYLRHKKFGITPMGWLGIAVNGLAAWLVYINVK